MAIMKMCSRCHTIIDRNVRLCIKCLEKAEKIEQNRMKLYDRERADRRETKFYASIEWRRVRPIILDRDNHKCIVCYKKHHKINKVDAIHHIIELKDDWDKRVDKENLICLCDTCHKQIHALYNKDKHVKIKIQEQLQEFIN